MILNSLIDAETMRQLLITKLSAGQAAKVKRTILLMVNTLHPILAKSTGAITVDKMNQVLDFLVNQYAPQLAEWTDDTMKQLSLFAADQAQFDVDILNSQLKESAFIDTIPAPEQILSAALATTAPRGREVLEDALNRYADRQYAMFSSATRVAFGTGQTGQELARTLYGGKMVTNYRQVAGLGAITRAQAQTLASTMTSAIASQSKKRIAKDNRDIVIGIKWLSTLDSKTSKQCKALDQQEFYYKDNPNPPMPAIHWGCRSATTLIIDGRYAIKDEGGTRPSVGAASSDEGDGFAAKERKASTDYYSWLKNQPAWFQDEALGAELGDIFRNSGLSAEAFRKASVDAFYNPLTIEEMAAKSKAIRDYINAD